MSLTVAPGARPANFSAHEPTIRQLPTKPSIVAANRLATDQEGGHRLAELPGQRLAPRHA